jgi:uncharacterized membrane protein
MRIPEDRVRLTPDGPVARVVIDHVRAPRRVPMDAPWHWLAAGWRDLWTIPQISLCYGGVFCLAAGLLLLGLARVQAQSLFLALASGFLLIGPLLGTGLYDASRRLALGQPVHIGDVIRAGLGARGQIMFFGALLLFVFMLWLQIALLLLMLFFGTSALPPADAFMHALLFTQHGLGLLIVGTLVGSAIATFVFAISTMALPLLLTAQIDAVSAAKASLRAVARNPKPMALWAALIAGIMGSGFVMLLIGLIIAFPLIGHATWHAFQDIYGDGDATP